MNEQASRPRLPDRNRFYPESFHEAEEELRRKRRGCEGNDPPPPAVGVGLSGGGIRSATFCLGVFQSLSRRGLVGSIDYMSTVSGGGYFGSFLGRLFTRDFVTGKQDVDMALNGSGSNGPDDDIKRRVLPWLRDNGRYLSPRGAGDLMTMLAGIVRNWVALHITLLSVLLLGAFLIVLVRTLAEGNAAGAYAWLAQAHCISERWGLWLSPFWVAAAVIFAAFAFPAGWAYWLIEWPSPESLSKRAIKILGLIVLVFLPAILFVFALNRSTWHARCLSWFGWSPKTLNLFLFFLAASLLVLVVRLVSSRPIPKNFARNLYRSPYQIPPAMGVAAVVSLLGWLFLIEEKVAAWIGTAIVVLLLAIVAAARWWPDKTLPKNGAAIGAAHQQKKDSPPQHDTTTTVFNDAFARNRLTSWLRAALMATGAVLAVTCLDSIGESLYRGSRIGGGSWDQGPLAALASLIAALAAPAAKVLPALLGPRKKRRSTAYLEGILAAIGLVIAAAILSGTFWLAHAVRWQFGPAPRCSMAAADTGGLTVDYVAGLQQVRLTMTTVKDPTEKRAPAAISAPGAEWLAAAAAISLLFALLFGATWTFLNNSSQLPFYKARLARAYLGASNRVRLEASENVADDPGDVGRAVRGDDIDLLAYFGVPCVNADTLSSPDNTTFKRGAPLHLINVTINETTGGRSQVQQQDRKGLGFCLGPCGLSAGVDDHVVFDRRPIVTPHDLNAVREKGPWIHLRCAVAGLGRESRFLPAEGNDSWMTMEPLTLGHWIAISGAAFSTGTGYRTSLGLSFLAGVTNVRLGYWWDSRREPRRKRSMPAFMVRRALAVQAYLLQEFLARFPGTSLRHWYLSDGGHFENLGGYELIRRRLPLIILVDAEADPDFEFGGLASLVRKARIDFGAEVYFLEDRDLAHLHPKPAPGTIGTLDQLKRGKWEADAGPSAPVDQAPRTLTETDPLRYSHVHAALAIVTYPDSNTWSMLVYVKASMSGDESLDLCQYHREHEAFPHEPTSDQFFDEAQWESYRKLGEHVADEVFGGSESAWNPKGFELPHTRPWIDLVKRHRARQQQEEIH